MGGLVGELMGGLVGGGSLAGRCTDTGGTMLGQCREQWGNLAVVYFHARY